MADLVAFAGPSVPPLLRGRWPGVEWRGPAVAGDGLDLFGAGVAGVVLIDGLFDQAPAIRHKELLMLMAQGVTVFGAASMGALRAAELAAFGMVGVGAIFTAFHRGALTGDDEVALLHGPGELEWAAWTTPLVNVRATLLAAVRRRIIGAGDARRLLAVAQSIFYQDRRWNVILAQALARACIDPGPLERFAGWVGDGEVDLKQKDAIACLDLAVTGFAAPGSPIAAPPLTIFTRTLMESRPAR